MITHLTVLPGRAASAYCWPVAERAAEPGPRRPTAAEVAAAVGLTLKQMQKCESGANRIGASRLYEFATVLDVPVSYFFEDSTTGTRRH